MRLLYGTLTLIIYPLLIILIFFRKIINKEDKNRYKEKIFPSNEKKDNVTNNKFKKKIVDVKNEKIKKSLMELTKVFKQR